MILDRYKVVASYRVPSGREYRTYFMVEIHREGDKGYYLVTEPYEDRLIAEAMDILAELEDMIGYDESFFEDPMDYLMGLYNDRYVEEGEDGVYALSLRGVVEHVIIKEVLGYSYLTPLLADEDVEDVVLSAPNTPIQVWHRRYPELGWIETSITPGEEEVNRMVRRLAFRAGKTISILQPVMEGILPERYRVTATWMGEVSPRGSSFTIRKFRWSPLRLSDLVASGFIPGYLASFLLQMMLDKAFIMIIGPSGSGKTTLLNALLLEIPSNRRIVTVEETPEINLMDRPGWKPLSTRWDADPEAEMERLLRTVLRERADYIAVGESRGREVRLVFQAAATGHGCLTTFHASTLRELQSRLVSSPIKLDRDVVGLLDVVVVLEIDGESRRYVKEVYLRRGERWLLLYSRGMPRKRFYEAIAEMYPKELVSRVETGEELVVGVDGSQGDGR